MRTIWKYKLAWRLQEPGQGVVMPRSAQVVHFAVQAGEPCIWALVEDAETEAGSEVERRMFVVVGTGQAVPTDGYEFRATTLDGPYVWHLFERVLFPITTTKEKSNV